MPFISTSKYLAASVVISCLLADSGMAQRVPLILQPHDLQPGDPYRLAFVTSSRRDAVSTETEDYNAFVQSVADDAPVVGPWELSWQAIVSTEAVNARQNTQTEPGVDVGVPVYRLDGVLLIQNSLDFWDPITVHSTRHFDITELGTELDPTAYGEDEAFAEVWTGTTALGLADSDGYLGHGDGSSRAGVANDQNAGWFVQTGGRNQIELPLYAISDVLIAVPEPSSSSGVVWLACLYLFNRAWWRSHHR